MNRIIRGVLYEVAERLGAPLVAPIYSGVGTILVFHRVVEPPARRAGWPRHLLEMQPAAVEALITRLRGSGHAFVSIDELQEALTRPRASTAKLVVMTFDDGYADTHDVALPLLESHGVPFTLYLTTDIPDGRLVPWWYIVERALTRGPLLSLQHRGRALRFELERQEQRDAAFAELEALFEGIPAAGHRALAEALFGPEEVARAVRELFIRWEQVTAMAAHPLVTIGAHTVSHPVLKELPLSEARREMVESRSRIEARIGRPVRHFAYPYGKDVQAGAREFALAKECGFETAVTTRLANIFPGHAGRRECLPRISGRTPEHIELFMTGVAAVIQHRGRRVVTV
jgi:peptidoglycan/xylan/chitin deacetylase (PgdA/CDA1 family)